MDDRVLRSLRGWARARLPRLAVRLERNKHRLNEALGEASLPDLRHQQESTETNRVTHSLTGQPQYVRFANPDRIRYSDCRFYIHPSPQRGSLADGMLPRLVRNRHAPIGVEHHVQAPARTLLGAQVPHGADGHPARCPRGCDGAHGGHHDIRGRWRGGPRARVEL